MSIYARLTRDDDDNMTLFYKAVKNSVRLAYDSLGAIALNGVTAILRYGNSYLVNIFFARVL